MYGYTVHVKDFCLGAQESPLWLVFVTGSKGQGNTSQQPTKRRHLVTSGTDGRCLYPTFHKPKAYWFAVEKRALTAEALAGPRRVAGCVAGSAGRAGRRRVAEVRRDVPGRQLRPGQKGGGAAVGKTKRGKGTKWMVLVDGQGLSQYFDTIRHSVLLDKIAKRVQDPQVLHLVKQIINVGGKIGVPQGGPLSPLAANIYLNEVDWTFDAIRQKTAEGDYEAVNYHRFADDIVITVSGHHTKRGWAERALQRLHEQLAPLGVELNKEKTKVVDALKGEAFGFLGFDLRRTPKRKGHYIQMTPKKKARKAIKAKVRDIIQHSGATPMPKVVAQINASLAGWVNYFRVGNASGAFSEVRDYTEMKVRTLLTRRKRRRKTSTGWRRWSSEYLYATLGPYWDWKVRPLPGAESMSRKSPASENDT